MNRATRRKWEGRFEYTNGVWDRRGLSGRAGSQDSFDLWRLMGMYRGEQHWAGGEWSGFNDGDKTIANMIFDAVNTAEAQLMARAPRALLFPRNKSAKSADGARIAQVALNYYIDELRMKRQVTRAQKDAMFAPVGAVIHGYTPTQEFFDDDGKLLHRSGNMKPDLPWIKRLPIWDLRFDLWSGSLHPNDMGWFAFRDLLTADQIRKNPGMKGMRNKTITPTVRFNDTQMIPESMDSETSEDWNEFVEVWTVYDQTDGTWFQWSDGVEDKVVREEEEWRIQWDGLPISTIGFNDQMDDPMPEPYMHALLPIQVERNKVRSMMSTLTRSLRRILAVNTDALTDDSARKVKSGDLALLEILELNGVDARTAFNETQIGNFPQDLLIYENKLREDAREKMGQSEMDRADRVNVETAQEAGQIQRGSDTQKARNQGSVEDHWKDVLEKFTQAWRQTAAPSELIPIVGIEDVQSLLAVQGTGAFEDGESLLEVSGDVAAQDYLVRIQVGSTMPPTRQEALAIADSWLEIAKNFPENVSIQNALIQAARARGLNPAAALQNTEALQQAAAVGQQRDEQGVPQPQGGAPRGGGTPSPLAVLGGGQG